MNGKRISTFKRISVSLLMMAMVAAAASLYGCGSSGAISNKVGKYKVTVKEGYTQVTKEIFVFTSDFYRVNMTLLVSGKEAVLIDTGMYFDEFQRAQKILDDKKLKLKNVIITHQHSDHNANLNLINTQDIATVTPENAEDGQIIKFGDKTLKIVFTEGHYKDKGHLSVEMVEDNILIAGDIICNNIIPPIAAGGDFLLLLDTLNKLEDKNYSLIIPGHGEIVDPSLLFERQFEYLENAKSAVEKVIASGGEIKDLSEIKLEDCVKDTLYLEKERLDYWHRTTLEVIYKQLKK